MTDRRYRYVQYCRWNGCGVKFRAPIGGPQYCADHEQTARAYWRRVDEDRQASIEAKYRSTCIYCGAPPEELCVTWTGLERDMPHAARGIEGQVRGHGPCAEAPTGSTWNHYNDPVTMSQVGVEG